jgi:glycosyltransferase involved in cell wall biosynthesis
MSIKVYAKGLRSKERVTSPKKILDCYACLEFGGLSRHIVTEVNGLQARGHDLYLALQDARGELIAEVSPEVRVFGLGYQGLLSYPLMFWNLVGIVRQLKPQVVVSHSWAVNTMVYAAALFQRPSPRIVLFHHTLAGLYDQVDSVWARWRSYLLKQAARRAYRRADAIVAVSPKAGEDLVIHLGVLPERIHVIPSLWSMEQVEKGALEPLDDPWFMNSESKIPIVLSCGALVPAKNFPMLVRAFALVRQRRAVRLAIVGEGPLASALLTLAQELGIADDFRILGYQSNPAKYMARADVFALSSTVEGFGTVLIEALLLGLPVVATNVAGPSFVLDGGNYGLLVPSEDEHSMAEAILTLLDNDALRVKLVKGGPERALFFSPDNTLDRIERVLLGRQISSKESNVDR